MSYILDALKKSDAEAQRGQLPSIHSHQNDATPANPRPAWLLLLSGALITATLAFALNSILTADKQNTENMHNAMPSTTMPSSVTSEVAHSTLTSQQAAASIKRVVSNRNTPPVPEPVTNKVSNRATGIPDTATNIPFSRPSAMTEQADTSRKVAALRPLERAATSASPDTPEVEIARQKNRKSLPLRSKLPVSVQQSLPPIQIAGHIFDEQSPARMVFINGHIQREGDRISPGLILLAITPEGVELEFRGTGFRIDIVRHRGRRE